MRPGYKLCPVCGTRAELDAKVCFTCGHRYRTQFGPQDDSGLGQGTQPGQGGPGQPGGLSQAGHQQGDPHWNPPQQGSFGHPGSPQPQQGQAPGYGAFSQPTINQNPQYHQQPPGFQQPPQYGALPPSYGPNPPGYGAFGQGATVGGGQISVPPGSINPTLNCLLCILMPGIGQMLNKQVAKGIVIMVCTIVSCVFCCVAPLLVVPVACWDAYAIGKKLNEGRVVGQWEWF